VTFKELTRRFPSDDACLDFLKERSFPAGTHCPSCAKRSRFHRITGRSAFSCQYCGHHVYPTAGTVFHKSRTSLQLWFYAIELVRSEGRAMSARRLEREIGVSTKTAQRMLRQIGLLLEHDPNPLESGHQEHVPFKGNRTRAEARGSGRENTSMSKRVALTAFAVLGALAVSIVFGMSSGSHQSSKAAKSKLGMASRMHQASAFPGLKPHGGKKLPRGGDASGEANGPAQEAYDNLAYPATRVAFAQAIASHSAYAGMVSKAKSSPKTIIPSGWQPKGPTTLDVNTLGTQDFGAPTQWSGRVTALASYCANKKKCTLYSGAAGGGVWKSTNPLAATPTWTNVSDNWFTTTSIGSITIDPTDKSGKTIYVGTGEPNGSSDSEAGVGVYKSTDAGATWSLMSGSVAVSKDRGIAAIVVDPSNKNHLLMGTNVARHGASNVNGGRFTPPGAPTIGLYESTNGGNTWSLAFSQPQDTVNPGTGNGSDFFRGGVTKIQFDPNNPSTYYFSMTGYGLYRNAVGGYEKLFTDDETPSLPGGQGLEVRFEFAAVATGKKSPVNKKVFCTRIYLGAGWQEAADDYGAARLYRANCVNTTNADDLTTGGTGTPDDGNNPGWTDLSSDDPADPGFGSYDWCQNGQCSYDSYVVSPPGQPNTVYLGGSMHYSELPLYPENQSYPETNDISNGRAVVRSTDAGVSFTDMTGDATPTSSEEWGVTPYESMHPDEHALVFNTASPGIWWAGSDGGIIRAEGKYVDNSQDCNAFWRGYFYGEDMSEQDFANCDQFLSSIPKKLTVINSGLNTLQFEGVAPDPQNPTEHMIGGLQDNGTIINNSGSWFLGVTGDGGNPTINSDNSNILTHTYTGGTVEVSFDNGSLFSWDWIGDPLYYYSGESASFYAPFTADRANPGTIYAGLQHVWRTQDNGGDQSFLDNYCEATGLLGLSTAYGSGDCGDWVALGNDLTLSDSGTYGTDKSGNYVVQAEPSSDGSVLWAATRRGRIFVSDNPQASDESTVNFFRVDTAAEPTRFPSAITVDPTDPYTAYVSYSGYNAYATAAGTGTGHVFKVTVDSSSCAANFCTVATWENLDYNIGDQPVTNLRFDKWNNDLYAGTDYGVYRLDLDNAVPTWALASSGLPPVAVYDLDLQSDPNSCNQILTAGTHGRGVWQLSIPSPC